MGDSNLIKIRGAKTHNLKNIDLDIQINKITCFAGPSGSGKTSLAFHTLYLESKRRLINSFPNQVKFFWDIPQTVEVDHISPVLPVWGIKQSNPILGSRLNFSDLINITEDLQKLFYFEGEPYCPEHKIPLVKEELNSKIINLIHEYEEGTILSLLCLKVDYLKRNSGVLPSRSFNEVLAPFNPEDPWWEIKRVKSNYTKEKLEKILEEVLDGEFQRVAITDGEKIYEIESSQRKSCRKCDYFLEDIWNDLSAFSPFNPMGACGYCKGHGNVLRYDFSKMVRNEASCLLDHEIHLINYSKFLHYWPDLIKEAKKKKINLEKPIQDFNQKEKDFLVEGSGNYPGFNRLLYYLESKKYKKNVRIYCRGLQNEYLCTKCEGSRLDPAIQSIHIKYGNKLISYQDVFLFNVEELEAKCSELKSAKGLQKESYKVLKTVANKLKFSRSLGLDRIQFSRKAKTLTSGEYQKSILVKVLSYEGSGSLFVLDEPSLGMDVSSQKKFMKLVQRLNDQGNTIIIIDHSPIIQSFCDELILLGPEAGDRGGKITYQGPYVEYGDKATSTLKKEKLSIDEDMIFEGIECLGIKKKKVVLKKECLNLIHGPSGTGKSSIILKAIANELHTQFFEEKYSEDEYSIKKIKGLEDLDSYSSVNIFEFKPAKGNARSTIGTKLGVSSFLRDHFAALDVSKTLGLKAGHFSPNSPLGKCPHCEGSGEVEVDMNFIENLSFTCPECNGGKLKPSISRISNGRYLVSEVFSFSLKKIFDEFKLPPKINRLSQYVQLLKLDYLQIDRKLSSLSGGEQQRFNFLSHLNKSKGKSILFFENLSFGLGPRELTDILKLLQKLVAQGHMIVAIDQNPLFQKVAQNIINFK